jgi:hypothetical protein
MPLPAAVDALIALVISLGVVALGWFVNARTVFFRPPPNRSQTLLATGALAAGVAVGVVVLVQAWILAAFDPEISYRYARFAGEPWVATPSWPTLRAAWSSSRLVRECSLDHIARALAAMIRRHVMDGRPVSLCTSCFRVGSENRTGAEWHRGVPFGHSRDPTGTAYHRRRVTLP